MGICGLKIITYTEMQRDIYIRKKFQEDDYLFKRKGNKAGRFFSVRNKNKGTRKVVSVLNQGNCLFSFFNKLKALLLCMMKNRFITNIDEENKDTDICR